MSEQPARSADDAARPVDLSLSGQAVFLRALAAHIERHVLPPVNIASDHSGGWSLQMLGRAPAHDATDVAAWARSIGVTDLSVRSSRLTPQVVVEATGHVDGWPVRPWGRVDTLRGAAGLVASGVASIDVNALAHLAEHGHLPGGAS